MPRKRKHEAGFIAKVALAAVKEVHTIQQLAGQFGVHPTQIHKWKRRLLDGAVELFQRPGKESQDNEAEVVELYEQIGRLKMELEWLKKKAAPFG
jgi:transposase-like protein